MYYYCALKMQYYSQGEVLRILKWDHYIPF